MNLILTKTFTNKISKPKYPLLGLFYQTVILPYDPTATSGSPYCKFRSTAATSGGGVGNNNRFISYMNPANTSVILNYLFGTPGLLTSNSSQYVQRSKIYPAKTIVEGADLKFAIIPPDEDTNNVRYNSDVTPEFGFTIEDGLGVVLLYCVDLIKVKHADLLGFVNDEYGWNDLFADQSEVCDKWLAGMIYSRDSSVNKNTDKEIMSRVSNAVKINFGSPIACDFRTNTFDTSLYYTDKLRSIPNIKDGGMASHWQSNMIKGSVLSGIAADNAVEKYVGNEYGRYINGEVSPKAKNGAISLGLSGIIDM